MSRDASSRAMIDTSLLSQSALSFGLQKLGHQTSGVTKGAEGDSHPRAQHKRGTKLAFSGRHSTMKRMIKSQQEN